MRAVLEVRSGSSEGRKADILAGQALRVGRTNRADFVVAQDTQMSSVHFVLECDRRTCTVRDMHSSNGTFVNGDRVNEAILRDGDQILAGQTTFAVRIALDIDAPLVETPAILTPPRATPAERLAHLLRAPPEPLFGLLDAAREPRVLQLIRRSGDEHQSLYEGFQGRLLADFAPYLVHLPPESTLLEALVAEGWGKSWGMYLTSARPFKEVRRHLRHFLMVKNEDDAEEAAEERYFRFYDPRVLRVFLPTFTPRQARMFFGEVRAWLMEGEEAEMLLEFTLDVEGMRLRAMGLGSLEG